MKQTDLNNQMRFMESVRQGWKPEPAQQSKPASAKERAQARKLKLTVQALRNEP